MSVTTGLVTTDHLRQMEPSEPSMYSVGVPVDGEDNARGDPGRRRCPFLDDLPLPWPVPLAPDEVLQASPADDRLTREQLWNVHPFGMSLLRHIVGAYETVGDCQTLAALTCVLRMGEISEITPDANGKEGGALSDEVCIPCACGCMCPPTTIVCDVLPAMGVLCVFTRIACGLFFFLQLPFSLGWWWVGTDQGPAWF
jgi:hypothetical protein